MWKVKLRVSSSRKSWNEVWSGRIGLSSSSTPSSSDARGLIIFTIFKRPTKRTQREVRGSGSRRASTTAITSRKRF